MLPKPIHKNSDPNPESHDLCTKIMNSKNYYETLMISSDCEPSEIKKQFKKLVLIIHPDKCKNSNANNAFLLLSKAFQCLSDPQKRELYDQKNYDLCKEDTRISMLIIFIPFCLTLIIAVILQYLKTNKML